MQTWLVTGARGFLGSNVGVMMRDSVRLIGQSRTPFSSAHYAQVVGLDLRDHAGVAAAVQELRPDVILHAAAMSGHDACDRDREQAYAVNVGATSTIARAAAAVGACMVHVSTDAIFSGSTGGYSEESAPDPFSYYGETKLAGEDAVRAALDDHLIIRTNFFGWSETGHKSVLEFFVDSLREGRQVRGYPDYIVTSIYVPALVEAIGRLVGIEARGTVNVASSDAVSKHDFGVLVAQEFGLDATLIERRNPDPDASGPWRRRDLSLDTSKAAALLGERLATQHEGVARARTDETTLGAQVRQL